MDRTTELAEIERSKVRTAHYSTWGDTPPNRLVSYRHRTGMATRSGRWVGLASRGLSSVSLTTQTN